MSQSTIGPAMEFVTARPYESGSLVRARQKLTADFILAFLARGAAAVVLLMLAALIAVLLYASLPSIKEFGARFLVSSEWVPPREGPKLDAKGDPVLDEEGGGTVMELKPGQFGALPVIYGTAVSSAVALVLAVPLSFGAALFLVRISPRVLVEPISFLIEFLAAIPSIAYGIWGLFILAPFLSNHVEPGIKSFYDGLPAGSWLGCFCGAAILVLGITLALWLFRRTSARKSHWAPLAATVIPLALTALALVWAPRASAIAPGVENSLRLALGGPPNLRWMFQEKVNVLGEMQTREYALTGRDLLCGGLVLTIMILPIITAISRDVLKSVPRAQLEGTVALGATWWQSSREMLRYSRSGLFGAVMLGLARAAGETMAVTMVIGNNNQVRASLLAPLQTMSSLLANEFREATYEIHIAALSEVALILLVMSLLFNVAARYLVVGKGSKTSAAH